MFTVETLNVWAVNFLSWDFKIIDFCIIFYFLRFEKQFFRKIPRFLENFSEILRKLLEKFEEIPQML